MLRGGVEVREGKHAVVFSQLGFSKEVVKVSHLGDLEIGEIDDKEVQIKSEEKHFREVLVVFEKLYERSSGERRGFVLKANLLSQLLYL